MSSSLKASSTFLRLHYRRRPAAPATAWFASLSGHQQGDLLALRRLRFLLPDRPISSSSSRSSSSSSNNSGSGSGSSSSSSSSGSSGSNSSSSDDKTVSEVKAEVEQLSQESTSNKDQWGNRGKLLYEGSISHQVRGLKRVSITTCLISILGVPALYVYGKEGVPMAGQVAVMGTALAGTGSSTLLLNLCVSPYIFRMAEILGHEEGSKGEGRAKMRNKKNRYGMPKISGRRFRVERMNIFGVRSTTEFSIDEVEPMPNTSRPFVSFKANGKYYYIQGHDMEDKVLLKTLLGRDLKDHEK